jgi:hypothetical protein
MTNLAKRNGAQSFSTLELRDLRNARALIEHLQRILGHVYIVPGIESALQSAEKFYHNRARGFVEEYLSEAGFWCELQIEELERQAPKYWKMLAEGTAPWSSGGPLTFAWREKFCSASLNDIRNALKLLNYLTRCHRAVLEAPGIDSALQSTAEAGIHCYDRAYVAVSNYLAAAREWCEQRLQRPKRKLKLENQGPSGYFQTLGR